MNTDKGYFRMGLICGSWPSVEMKVEYQGRCITIEPPTDTTAPSVVTETDGMFDQIAARKLIQEFLSGLAWLRKTRFIQTSSHWCTGPHLKVGNTKRGGTDLIDNSQICDVPDPQEKKAKLVLALYREAISVNMVPYQFLGFFKIINVLHRNGKDQKEWINNKINVLAGNETKSRISELQKHHNDIGHYLYESGRCAVAHAYSDPIINPDNPEDVIRLRKDLPIIRNLAESALENEFSL